MTTISSDIEKDIGYSIRQIAAVLESKCPMQPVRTFLSIVFLDPKRRLLRVAERIKKSGTLAVADARIDNRLAVAFKKILGDLDNLDRDSSSLVIMDAIVEILDCLDNVGVLSDEQQQAAAQARQNAAQEMIQRLVPEILEQIETGVDCIKHIKLISRMAQSGRLPEKDVLTAFAGSPVYNNFSATYDKMIRSLGSLKKRPYDLDKINSIINVLNSLHRIGVLTDSQKLVAVKARQTLDNVKVVKTFEEEWHDDGGMSGSDPCPSTTGSTTYTRTLTPARLDF